LTDFSGIAIRFGVPNSTFSGLDLPWL